MVPSPPMKRARLDCDTPNEDTKLVMDDDKPFFVIPKDECETTATMEADSGHCGESPSCGWQKCAVCTHDTPYWLMAQSPTWYISTGDSQQKLLKFTIGFLFNFI